MIKALKTLESIKYSPGELKLLDQLQLPLVTVFDDMKTVQDVWRAIREMRVRGAPAIAVCAALGIAVAAQNKAKNAPDSMTTVEQVSHFLTESLDYIITSRPTAVNLSNTVNQLMGQLDAGVVSKFKTGDELINYFVKLAESVYNEDVAFNEGIMKKGAAHILRVNKKKEEKVNILTICNTGALATSRYGTALGVVRQLFYDGELEQLYACETRPWNQGSRLTIYECEQEGIPATLICDSTVSFLMKTHRIDAVIVGADRICCNGDTANKIGTYNIAVAAKYHGVPFYVAAPSSTLDLKTLTGAEVHIEERDTFEITHNMATKQRVVVDASNISVWNPVFDITPAELITGGIITEKGVTEPNTSEGAQLYNIMEIVV